MRAATGQLLQAPAPVTAAAAAAAVFGDPPAPGTRAGKAGCKEEVPFGSTYGASRLKAVPGSGQQRQRWQRQRWQRWQRQRSRVCRVLAAHAVFVLRVALVAGEDWDAACARCGWTCEADGYDDDSSPLAAVQGAVRPGRGGAEARAGRLRAWARWPDSLAIRN